MSKERPILFSAPMVRVLLAGKKTLTRRVVSPSHVSPEARTLRWENQTAEEIMHSFRCPYGVPGDRLWVRETWQFVPPSHQAALGKTLYAASCPDGCEPPRWRSSIHMPRWAARILLEVTGVRVERVQDISESDAIAEGCGCYGNSTFAVLEYGRLWESINGKGSWAKNPWVWVVAFKVIGSAK